MNEVKSLSCVRLFATPWTVAYHAPPSMGFSRQEYWTGLPFPSDRGAYIFHKTFSALVTINMLRHIKCDEPISICWEIKPAFPISSVTHAFFKNNLEKKKKKNNLGTVNTLSLVLAWGSDLVGKGWALEFAFLINTDMVLKKKIYWPLCS